MTGTYRFSFARNLHGWVPNNPLPPQILPTPNPQPKNLQATKNPIKYGVLSLNFGSERGARSLDLMIMNHAL
ncbi:MAG: hypothetical protein RLY61_777 [Candidatus Parcubacteria bacterium]